MSKNFIPDISHHDPITSWSTIAKSCDFLITKATEGMYFVDPTLNSFIQYCEKYKIPYWVYTFLKKGNELAQTKYMVSMCKNRVGSHFVGYVLDIERQNDARNIQEALDWLNKQGTKTMLYTQYSQYSKYKDVIANRGNNCAWWECRYGKNTGIYNSKYPCHQGVDLHQFTENGRIDGVKGLVDLNRLTETKPSIWFKIPLTKSDSIKEAKKQEIQQKVKEDLKANEKVGYKDIFPVMSPRGFFQKGDGISALTNYPTQLKRVQRLINWIDDSTKDITVDGQFGQKTENKVRTTQKILGVPITGKFDQATLKAAKAYKK